MTIRPPRLVSLSKNNSLRRVYFFDERGHILNIENDYKSARSLFKYLSYRIVDNYGYVYKDRSGNFDSKNTDPPIIDPERLVGINDIPIRCGSNPAIPMTPA